MVVVGRRGAAALGWWLASIHRARERRTLAGERRRVVGGEVDGWGKHCVRVGRRRADVAVQVRINMRGGHCLCRVVAITLLRDGDTVINLSERPRRHRSAVELVLVRALMGMKVLDRMAGEGALAALDERLLHLDWTVRAV